MIHYYAVIRLLGQFLLLLAAAMLVPLVMDILFASQQWQHFAIAALITGIVGAIGVAFTHKPSQKLSLRDGFLLMTLAWFIVPVFAAIPLYLSLPQHGYTDMLFEAVSGLTTTGATTIVQLETLGRGLLLWRSLLQWLGGIAIVLMAVVLMPKLGVGGMQLFRSEVTDRNEKAMPRTTEVALWIVAVYAILTILATLAYNMAGMNAFDALNHAMTSISTGGFSTYDASFGHFQDPVLVWIAIAVMIIGSLPFILYVKMLRGDPFKIFYDQQVRYFLGLLLLFCVIMSVHQIWSAGWPWQDTLTLVLFNVTSIMTGTGYTNANYDTWGGFAVPFFFAIMVIGGCAGSTSCGIKVFRFVVLKEAARVQLLRLLNPRGVFIAYYNQKPIEETISDSVQGFFLLFGVTFVIISWGLALSGLDFLTAMSAASSAIANVGPGLGQMIGPDGNYTTFTPTAKWIMMFGMLVGRMEIYSFLIILLPSFWRH